MTPPPQVLLIPDGLRPFRTEARDYEETQELLAHLRELRANRQPFYLTEDDLELIYRWKLERQYGRQQAKRARNTDAVYRAITRAAFEVDDGGSDYEAEVRLGVLMALPGIGIGVASAILALGDPARYCVIDFRGWRSVFAEERRDFWIPQYVEYRRAVKELAQALDWSVQETDLAAWAMDETRS